MNFVQDTSPPATVAPPPAVPPTVGAEGDKDGELAEDEEKSDKGKECALVEDLVKGAAEDRDTGRHSSNIVLAFCSSLKSLVISAAANSEIYLACQSNQFQH